MQRFEEATEKIKLQGNIHVLKLALSSQHEFSLWQQMEESCFNVAQSGAAAVFYLV